MQVLISYRRYQIAESFAVVHLNMSVEDAIDYVYNVLNADCLVSVNVIE